jgi:hypothetical protein
MSFSDISNPRLFIERQGSAMIGAISKIMAPTRY